MRQELQQTKRANPRNMRRFITRVRNDRALILLMLPGLAYYLIFHYFPMYGVWMAFTNFNLSKTILASDFVGFKWFAEFFNSFFFWRLLRNTLTISVLNLLWGFPLPIILALTLNELKNRRFKKMVQTISYLPHFISTVVVVGIMTSVLSPNGGIVNTFIKNSGQQPINFMGSASWFRSLYIGSGVWQSFGWNSIIYLAALMSIDPGLYEAARIDGANRFQQVLHVSIPSIMPTIVILLIMQLGRTMSVGYEKIILMYTPATYETADVISTYVYRRGITGGQYSFGAAVGLFNNVVNMALLLSINAISRRVNEVSLW